jgi:2,5-diketo-D-gluconate reductase A
MSTIPNITLNNGVEMPILGFGVYQIEPEGTERCVADALEVGYRHIDTAAAYCNEVEVGRALATSGIPRDQLFITTKVWPQDAGEAAASLALDASLRRLGLGYVDLYLIHQPYGDYYGSWRAMQDALGDGRARAIGVSNFHPDRLVDLIDHNDIVPAVNQVETHPFFQRADYQAQMDGLGVQIESWGPFAEGRGELFTHPVLSAIAAEHHRSVAQVVLRWLLQRNVVVIPKSVRRDRMAENIDVFSFSLTDHDMARIAELDTGESAFFDHRDPGMTHYLGTSRFD